jgi:DNA replication protein DnaC
MMRQLGRVDLLILDDWGPEPLLPEQQRDLLEIVEDRYNAGSLIITSQLPVDRWYELVGNPPSPTPSSIASSTTLIGSSSAVKVCASSELPLDHDQSLMT